MKIRILTENTAKKPYSSEHGLCIYAETKKHKLLLDTGRSELFLENARVAGVDISSVDTVFISHGHYDHTGGLKAFLYINSKAKIYFNNHAFDDLYSMHGKEMVFIGTDAALENNPQTLKLIGDTEVDDELFIFNGVNTHEFTSAANKSLFEKSGDGFIEDRFLSEQNLVINENGKRVLYAGCAHMGIVNILNRFIELYGEPPYAVVGGFHLMIPREGKTIPADIIRNIAIRLSEYPTQYYTGHCTGIEAFNILKETLKDKLQYISTGNEINI